MGEKDKADAEVVFASIHFHGEHLPPSELASQQRKDVQIRIWRAVVFAGRWAQIPAVRGVPWKGLHPTAHRNSVLSISECPPCHVTPSSFCEEAPVFTLSPHHHEQHGKSILVRGPLEFLVPERRLSVCIRCLSPFPDAPELTEALTQPGLVTQVLKHAWVAPTPHTPPSLCELK